MTPNQIQMINLATAGVAACTFAFFAGSASQSLAQSLVQMGGPSYLREPLNAGIAFLCLMMWQRWRPAARYSSPKWGHIAIGLGVGLLVGIALPALALSILTLTGDAQLLAPKVHPVALAVPFIFLIVHGFAEESMIRGIAQREGHNSFGPLAGVGLAAICFCALQASQGYFGIWHLVNGILFGTCLGLLALGPGGIWTAVGAHAGWSWLEIAVLGQAGQITKTASWFAGSGPDSYGSPAFTLVLVIVCALQLALHFKAKKGTI
jgi:membrane protease YdiL (CAAX protease family)